MNIKNWSILCEAILFCVIELIRKPKLIKSLYLSNLLWPFLWRREILHSTDEFGFITVSSNVRKTLPTQCLMWKNWCNLQVSQNVAKKSCLTWSSASFLWGPINFLRGFSNIWHWFGRII